MAEQTLSRNEEIRQIHKDYTTFYQLGGGLFLVLVGVLIGAVIFSDEPGYGTNIYTEILSVGLTILVLNGLQERRDTRNRIRDLQEQLVRDAGSPIHAVAVNAINTMRKRGWLGRKNIYGEPDDTEALLENADLSNSALLDTDLFKANLSGANLRDAHLGNTDLGGANLSGADLRGANLSNSELSGTNLCDAKLWQATLTNANLSGANLTKAKLWGADLNGANLRYANLCGAGLWESELIAVDLRDADLHGAHLREVNLQDADLRNANLAGTDLRDAFLLDTLIQYTTKFDQTTILPDKSNWSEGQDLAEFGAETRDIFNTKTNNALELFTYTFADGTVRSFQKLKGWLDDKDGNPIEEK